MQVEMLRITENPFMLISKAYRLCYNSVGKSVQDEEKFIAACIRNKHTSPLEHCSATFLVSGISRTCSHQLVRHRIASYTQESQRYVTALADGYIIPFSVAKNGKLVKQYQKHLQDSAKLYLSLMEAGVKREDARFVLPQAVPTKIMFTMNFRALRNFLELRLDPHAQWEIRKLAQHVVNLILDEHPILNCVFVDIIEKYQK